RSRQRRQSGSSPGRHRRNRRSAGRPAQGKAAATADEVSPLRSIAAPDLRPLKSAAPCTNICSMPVACALIPRFALLATLEERRRALLTRPLALAPEPGGPQVVGETSGPAAAFGVHAGMRLGEARARCPDRTPVARAR